MKPKIKPKAKIYKVSFHKLMTDFSYSSLILAESPTSAGLYFFKDLYQQAIKDQVLDIVTILGRRVTTAWIIEIYFYINRSASRENSIIFEQIIVRD